MIPSAEAPLVSAIIATYNRRDYVGQAIDSVLAQTYPQVELLVVDDGSTDGTGDLLQQQYGSRIRYVYQTNQGRSAARNCGMSLAGGDYIAFLDSDDMWMPDKLAHQVRFMQEHPEYGLTHTFSDVMDADGIPNREATAIRHAYYQRALQRGYTYEGMSRECIMFLSTVMVRRPLLDHIGAMDPAIPAFEDWDWYLRAALVTQIGTIRASYVYHRIYDGNTPLAELTEGRIKTSLKHLSLLHGNGKQDQGAQGALCAQLAVAYYQLEQLRECRYWLTQAIAHDHRVGLRIDMLRCTLTLLFPDSVILVGRRLIRSILKSSRVALEVH